MADPFNSDSLNAPARAPFALVPSDTVALATVPKRLFVGTGGHVTLRGVDGVGDVTYRNVASGVYLNVRPSHVRATGTTAADLIGEA
ncbi:spike base protein, RCAP_Rcc01079 family [Sphingomonas sp. Xoc002]|uniref:spike base protein, RCAP_Rcc01079 family n=1 Tax=Sphingomonas sp. Xoc002 TaxID=2837624 RepID=UPI003D181442